MILSQPPYSAISAGHAILLLEKPVAQMEFLAHLPPFEWLSWLSG